jgi:hypothetical protein
MSPPPRTAYLIPKDDKPICRYKLIKYLVCSTDGISDPKVNATYLQVLGEVNSGRLDEEPTDE